ncbi:MAG: hypothetical protein LBF41_08840 [Deltaproteobacteria bacterium]|jgi:hypothetical protein|nr:hypothetical protein [Deltaproteobacteria bacterium]
MNIKESADDFANTRGPDPDPPRIANEAIRPYAAKEPAKGGTPENINLSSRTPDRCPEAARERGIPVERPRADKLPRLSRFAKSFVSAKRFSKLASGLAIDRGPVVSKLRRARRLWFSDPLWNGDSPIPWPESTGGFRDRPPEAGHSMTPPRTKR